MPVIDSILRVFFDDEDDIKIGRYVILGFLGLILLILSFTSFYTVDADESAIVLRFGEIARETQPGLHFKIPIIESVEKVAVRKVFKQEFGYRTLKAGIRTEYDTESNLKDESLLLTGDLNSANVEWVVQYKISTPRQYLFVIRNAESTLRDITESVMSRIIGDRTVTEVLTIGRTSIAAEVKTELQKLLNDYETGLHVTTVTLQDVNPPDSVKAAFNEVNQAKQRKEQMINEAWRDYNSIIPKAKGLALQQIQEAEGYALKRTNEAKGDAERFNAILNKYNSAKEVTRRRMYLETLQDILPSVKEIYVVDPKTQGPIPILQLK